MSSSYLKMEIRFWNLKNADKATFRQIDGGCRVISGVELALLSNP